MDPDNVTKIDVNIGGNIDFPSRKNLSLLTQLLS